jgi:hypothetical protein
VRRRRTAKNAIPVVRRHKKKGEASLLTKAHLEKPWRFLD